jgi:glycosyltransferase involved in cell wall biosynthesis
VRIAIDARPAVSAGMTGIGHYTREMILRLPEVDPRSTYVAWYLNARRLIRPWRWGRRFFPRRPNLIERWTPFPAQWFERLSLRSELPRVEWFMRFDVLFAPNFVPPPTSRGRVVLTVHDLAFRRFPETAPLATRRWLQRLEGTLRRAAEVIVVSEATRRDLLELYPVDPARVTTIHHGIDTERYQPAPDADVARVRARLGLHGPYLLFLGGIEPRKNLPRLVRAFASGWAGAEGPALVIAGASVPWNPEGRQEVEAVMRDIPGEASDRIHMAGYVAGRDKVALLSGADALVFPSLYEGFGFPVLEAMACGTPVLTSNVSSLPEVAGDAALFVDPSDETSIAEGIGRLIDDPALRDRLRVAGRQRVEQFTWEQCARQTAAVLHRAAERSPARSSGDC